jgi:chromatin remodeling complex protein RSC6
MTKEDSILEESGDNLKIPNKPIKYIPTRNEITDLCDNIITETENEIKTIREGSGSTKGIKFLRQVIKNVKVLRSYVVKAVKAKKATNSAAANNSGFMKPVCISKELAEFTGWDPKQLHSRVDVTKYICNYVRERNLKDPADGRIIKPDFDLQKLLKTYNPDEGVLKYYNLQTHLKHHFPKTIEGEEDSGVVEDKKKVSKKKKSKKKSGEKDTKVKDHADTDEKSVKSKDKQKDKKDKKDKSKDKPEKSKESS